MLCMEKLPSTVQKYVGVYAHVGAYDSTGVVVVIP